MEDKSTAGPDPTAEGEEMDLPDTASSVEESTDAELANAQPMFAHPQWTVGVVLVFGAAALVAGIVSSPVWLVIGSPLILTLFLYIWIRFFRR
jgi:hypothetical protein